VHLIRPAIDDVAPLHKALFASLAGPQNTPARLGLCLMRYCRYGLQDAGRRNLLAMTHAGLIWRHGKKGRPRKLIAENRRALDYMIGRQWNRHRCWHRSDRCVGAGRIVESYAVGKSSCGSSTEYSGISAGGPVQSRAAPAA
jgi:hypothetical protein